jgi:peptide/nickel transport system ATP-binding protein/oligopeptide transport system ATP-binding protein
LGKEPLIQVKDLKTYFYLEGAALKAVDGVDFEVYPGETLGIVGESGCGKSVTSLSIMRLVDSPPGKIVSGEVLFDGMDLLKVDEAQIRRIRGNRISMIFQDPMSSLNPVYTIGDQIAESLILHKNMQKKEAAEYAEGMLDKVGISSPRQRMDEYPHQLSGGMRQRVMIAMALSCGPQLLIADEPTTALDVTIQAQILELMIDLQEKLGMSIMMITHNLGVIAEMANRVAVMYAGKVVEYSDVVTLFQNPSHPYTIGLINSIPHIAVDVERLQAIPGIVPSPLKFPKGCKFHTRCSFADEHCVAEEPVLEEMRPAHFVRCWHYHEAQQTRVKRHVP